jgi:8-oxo-dGTP pyrophosphatase MutT (NUDIX family)
MQQTQALGHPITASVLLTDCHDRLLIVRARDRWQLPGGLVEQRESPRAAAAREVREELGLDIDLREHNLLAFEWIEASTPDRLDRLALVFAGPRLDAADLDRITLQATELDEWRMVFRDDALLMLHPLIRRRIVGPLQLHTSTVYLETRNERTA